MGVGLNVGGGVAVGLAFTLELDGLGDALPRTGNGDEDREGVGVGVAVTGRAVCGVGVGLENIGDGVGLGVGFCSGGLLCAPTGGSDAAEAVVIRSGR